MVLVSPSAPPLSQRILIYAFSILIAVAAAVAGVRWLGLSGEETLVVEGAVLFLVAGSGCAPRLFSAVRQAGEFSGVESDRVMRSVLLILAVLMLIAVLVLHAQYPTT